MNKWLKNALRCPYCAGTFTVTHGTTPVEDGEYAVLSCYCEQYPVVAGIPVIRKGILGTKGETNRSICQFILSGKHQDALLAMLMPPAPPTAELAPTWLTHLPQIKGIGRVRSVLGTPAIHQWIKFAKDFLTSGVQGKTAHDYFDFYFLHSGIPKEGYNYFINRFGQPRQLVALSLMTSIKSPSSSVLDMGCGFGHLTCHLIKRVGHRPLIAADLNFTRLYVAKNFLAPGAFYVCCDGDTSWPFITQFFSVAYTSDTMYMVTNKVVFSMELQRVVDAHGLIIAAGIRNGLVEPQKYPMHMRLPYHAYRGLFESLPHRILANSDVLARYSEKCGPTLSLSSEKNTLDHEPWFSIVAANDEKILVDRERFADWPHAEGRLEVNPLYKPVSDHRGEGGEFATDTRSLRAGMSKKMETVGSMNRRAYGFPLRY
jgi:SAM-dependent methyltransferase